MERKDILAAYLDGDGSKITDRDEVIFTSNLRKKIQANILENLLNENDIIFHRYIYSLYTYYAGSQTLDMNWIYEQTKTLIKPDLVIYLKISLEEFDKRRKEKPPISFQSSKEFVERMYNCYEKLAIDNAWKIVNSEKLGIKDSVNKCMEYIDSLNINNDILLLNGESIDLYELYQIERNNFNLYNYLNR